MSTEDLTSPLRRAGAGSSRFRISSPILSVLSLILICAGIFGWFMMNRDPLGGEPRAVTDIKSPSHKTEQSSSEGTAMRHSLEAEKQLSQNQSVETSEEGEKSVSAKSSETPPDRIIISGGKETSTAPKIKPLPSAPIEGYFKRTKTGLLPQISKSGRTPAIAYARPLSFDVAPADKSKPRIAILITGLGISPSATGEAIRKLPGSVSLAFAPYANNLQTTVSKARNLGHEVMLQLPMEPFDYPDNDPAPHTLLADTSTRENNARIEWLLTRFAGYTGVTNYMGAKFTASPDAIKPFLKKIKSHGLFYFEDGASPRSQSGAIGKSIGTSYAKANVIIDSDQNNQNIRKALLKLENIARDKGLAVGVGSALPITISALSEWAKSLKEKDIILVPISSTALK